MHLHVYHHLILLLLLSLLAPSALGSTPSVGDTLSGTVLAREHTVCHPTQTTLRLKDYDGGTNGGTYFVTVIASFYTGCGPGRAEEPKYSSAADALKAKYPAASLAFLTTLKGTGSCSAWAALGSGAATIVDDESKAMHYNLFTDHPQYLVIDRTMTVRNIVSTAAAMSTAVEALVAEADPPGPCPPTTSNLGVGGLTSGLGAPAPALTAPGATVTAVCEAGYRAAGAVRCEDRAFVRHTATCTELGPCAATGTPSNFGIAGLTVGLGSPATTAASASVVATCDAGYTASGSVTCVGDGQWSAGTASCVPEQGCEATTSDLGVAGLTIGLGAGTASQSTAAASCADGHVAAGSISCANGAWSAGTATCQEQACVATATDLGVRGLRTGLGSGTVSQATFTLDPATSCEAGYVAAGALGCTKGVWQRGTATCTLQCAPAFGAAPLQAGTDIMKAPDGSALPGLHRPRDIDFNPLVGASGAPVGVGASSASGTTGQVTTGQLEIWITNSATDSISIYRETTTTTTPTTNTSATTGGGTASPSSSSSSSTGGATDLAPRLQQVTTRADRAPYHYMDEVTAISFGRDGFFATCQESLNNYEGNMVPNLFMGPSLYNVNSTFLVDAMGNPNCGKGIGSPGGAGSTGSTGSTGSDVAASSSSDSSSAPNCFLLHFDMLHESPLCMGIAHDPETATPYGHVYWLFDGHDGMLMRYDFERPHGPCTGYMCADHSEASVRRYEDIKLTREPGVASHLAADPKTRDLYIADTGAGRVLRVDMDSGRLSRSATVEFPIYSSMSPRFAYELWTCTEDEVFIDAAKLRGRSPAPPAANGTTTTTTTTTAVFKPSGLALSAALLYVADYETGDVFAFDKVTGLQVGDPVRTGLVRQVMGLTLHPEDGSLWFVSSAGAVGRVRATTACSGIGGASTTSGAGSSSSSSSSSSGSSAAGGASYSHWAPRRAYPASPTCFDPKYNDSVLPPAIDHDPGYM